MNTDAKSCPCTPACIGAACTCGCQAAPKIASACTCGCQQGKPCQCGTQRD